MATWPTSVPTDANLYLAVNELQTNLSSGVDNAVTTLPLNSTTSFPTVGLVLIDNEIIKYTGVSGATLTGCTRAFDGTSAAAHSSGAVVSFAICANHHNVTKDEIIALATYLSNNLGTGAQPLANGSRALASNGSGKIIESSVTSTELGYLSGVTSAIQTQINGKVSAASPTFTGTVTLPVTANSALQTGTAGVLEASATTKTELGYVSGVTSAIQTQLGTKAADSAVVHNTGTENVAGAKTFTTQLIGKGTATNDSAGAGYIGEIIESYIAATNLPTSGQWGDLTSITLTAGDWDVSVVISFVQGGATITRTLFGIGVTSGNNAPDAGTSGTAREGDNNVDVGSFPTAAHNSGGCIASLRVSLTGSTIHYLKVQGAYSVATPQARGRITARRVR